VLKGRNMKKTGTILVILLFAVAADPGSLANEDTKNAEGKKVPLELHNGAVSANQADKKVETKKVPLESIYSTSGQKPLKPVSAAFRLLNDGTKEYVEPYGHTLQEIYRRFQGGASNVFLARGDDIAAAVAATWEVYTARHPVAEPASLRSPPRKSVDLWLVAYLGVEGSGPAWLVKSATVSGKDIRLTYRWVGTEANDERFYFVWVPLGKLQPGTYTLELLDENRRQVTLVRRVIVPNK
jgi:hypothetical protein